MLIPVQGKPSGGSGASSVAQAAHIYSGQGLSLQGDKGRFVLPPQLRKQVREASEGVKTLCIAKHPSWPCLTAFGTSRVNEFAAMLDREEELAARAGRDFDRDMRSQQLFAFAEVPFDDSGRFLIPDHMVDLGEIEDQIYFQGAGGFIMMWNPAELAKMDDGFAMAKKTCTAMLASGKGRGK